jgi:polar amino acid transport system substrate-binding protein
VRRFVLAALVAILTVSAAACGSSTTNTGQQSILDKVLSSKVLKVATVDANPPWESLGADGKPTGYDIDIAKAVADTLGAQIQWDVTDSPGRVTDAQTGKVDLVVANFTATPKRALSIAFSIPYFIALGQFMVGANSKYNTLGEMNAGHAKVASSRGGTADDLVPIVCPNCQIVDFTSATDGISAIDAGQVDAAANDSLVNQDAMTKFPGRYKVIQGYYSAEKIALGIPPNDFKWTQFLNTWVSEFNDSGSNAALFRKWFGYDPPPLP